ncbi:MAG: hypothetical protein NXI07_02175 [bacterium]|nr:hypothetical protein [bacterium]
MSDENAKQEESWSYKDLFGGLIFSAVLLGFGVWMLINPEGSDEFSTEGRRGLYKSIIKWIWGTPGGIILALIGLLILWGTINGTIQHRKKKSTNIE